jgi:hypothetical protein
LDIIWLSAAIIPASFWISFRVQGGCNCLMTCTFFGLASIPRVDTM